MDLILIYISKKKYTNSSNFLKLYMPGTEIQAYLVTKVDKTINKQVFVACEQPSWVWQKILWVYKDYGI